MCEVVNNGERSTGESEMATATKTKRHAANGKSNGKPKSKRKAYVKTLREPASRKSKPKGKSANRKREQPLSRRTPPTGEGWAQRVARGLAIHREKLGMSVPAAAKEYNLDQHLWYRIESGALPQTTGLHIDKFLSALDLTIDQVLKLAP